MRRAAGRLVSHQEWGVEQQRGMGLIGWVWLAVVLIVPGVLAAGLASGIFGGGWGIAAAAGYLLAAGAWACIQGRLALRSESAGRLDPADAPGLFSLTAAIAQDLGIKRASLWLMPGGKPNALVCWSGCPAVAVTQSLVDSYSRVELEAVAVHCLQRLGVRELARTTVAVALRKLAGPVTPDLGPPEDARAAAFTRYPPALASAISKASPRTGPFAAFWFVGAGGSHVPMEVRTKALLDL